jgi:hypothetical protein
MDVILGKGDFIRSSSRFLALISLVLLTSVPAAAIPTVVTHADTTHCDALVVPLAVDELGTGGLFPPGEQIIGTLPQFAPSPTPPGIIGATNPGFNCNTGTIDSPFAANIGLAITNINPFDFSEVWYVANNPNGTNISNLDGAITVGGLETYQAFRIDKVGVNKPLISESLFNDGIFNSGETWVFLLQDYSNNQIPGLSANLLGAPGVGGILGDGSTGSIIAVIAPEPGTAGLLIVGLLGLARFGRKSA